MNVCVQDNADGSYITRANPRDAQRHSIVGVQSYKPLDFARQMNVSLANGWGIVRTIADLVFKQPEGKYILVKDPNNVSQPINCFLLSLMGSRSFVFTAFRPMLSMRALSTMTRWTRSRDCKGELCRQNHTAYERFQVEARKLDVAQITALSIGLP